MHKRKVLVLKKNILIFLLLSLSAFQMASARSFGQVRNLINADNKPYHFGFILGFNSMDFNVSHNGIVDKDGNRWYADQTDLAVGFTVGIIGDLRLAESFNLRFTPALMFGDRTLKFVDQNGLNELSVPVKSTIINFPLTVKARGQRRGNWRPYLLAGGSATLDLGKQKENVIMLKMMDYGIEFGFGIDCYLPYFKLAPEFKMYLGLSDVLERNRPEVLDIDDLKYTNALSKLTSRLFILSFNFE